MKKYTFCIVLCAIGLLVLYSISCTTKKTKPDTPYVNTLKELLAAGKDQNLPIATRTDSIDKAIQLTSKNPWDSMGLAILRQKGMLQFHKRQYDSFFLTNKLLYKKSKDITNLYLQGKASFNLGYYFHVQTNQVDSAFYYYTFSKNAFLKFGDSIQAGKKLLNIAAVQKKQNDFFGAKETLKDAIILLNASTDNNFLASSYNELATNHRKLLNFKDAIYFYDKAIEASKSKSNILIYKNNLAQLYSEIGNYEKAFKILKNVIADSILISNPIEYARVLHNLTYNKWKNGKTMIANDFLKALHLRKQRNDNRGLVSSYTELAEFYSKKEPLKAKQYLDSLLIISKKITMPEGELDALKHYMKLEPNTIAYRNRYIFLKDSLYQQELRVKTQFAKMKYDDAQEKAQIQRLETETAQKRAQLAEQKTQKVIFLSLSGFLLLSGIAYYFILAQRHKKEKLQEVYNTEKRISQDLHDGLANDVFGLMTKIQGEKNTNKPLLDQLEGIYKTTRQISHENAAISTGADFKDELDALIGNYQDDHTSILVKGMRVFDWSLLDEHKCVVVHRTIKELLVNLKKHAGASLASLQFEKQKNTLVISYTDNGIGFNGKKSNGIGLLNTENRIHSIGGLITFEPKQGSGVKAIISVPI